MYSEGVLVMEHTYRVLFLSRRNSARSIMAEAILTKLGKGRFQAFSAGIEPTEAIDPMVAAVLKRGDFPFTDHKPKHYREFSHEDAEHLDFVFTLSDTAAGEPYPEWPGLPVTAHWSSPDPTHFTGENWEKERELSRIMGELTRRIGIFVNLPHGSLDRMSLQSHVDEIAKSA